jgi:hypothetical protein
MDCAESTLEVHEEIVMNRPYINVEAILELFRTTVEERSSRPAAEASLCWLAGFLARERSTMSADDWDGLVNVGAHLWKVWDVAPERG